MNFPNENWINSNKSFVPGCRHCGHKLVRNGKRKLKYRKQVQRYVCTCCGKSISDNEFPWMKFPKKVVKTALALYHNGLSLEAVKEIINEIFGITLRAASAIWYWTQRFGKVTKRIVFDNLSDMLHLDETKLRTSQKGKFFIFWALKCPVTKILVAWHVSEHRTKEEAKEVLQKAKCNFPVHWLPKFIRTDSFSGYRSAIMYVFGFAVEHDKFKSFESRSNNDIETLFRCKHRFPKFRSLEAARNYVEGWAMHYNFIRRHSTIKRRPAELCGLPKMTWGDLINFLQKLFLEDINRFMNTTLGNHLENYNN